MICAHCTEEIGGQDWDPRPEICSECGEPPMVDGAYRLEERLGGGEGIAVYRATRLFDSKAVVVKEFALPSAQVHRIRAHFERQGARYQRLHHRGLPQIQDVFVLERDGVTYRYLIDEFLEGSNLFREMQQRQFTGRQVLEILQELAEIVEYLHRQNPPVVHGDIKPATILRFDNYDTLLLLNLGGAQEVRVGGGGRVEELTGSPGFRGPEQAEGPAVEASDIHGLGATAAALICGGNPHQYLSAGGMDRWPGWEAVAPRLRALIDDMVAPDPDDRPTIRQVVRRLEEVHASPARDGLDQAVSVVDWPTNEEALQKQASLSRFLVLLGVMVGVCVVVGIVALMGMSSLMDPDEQVDTWVEEYSPEVVQEDLLEELADDSIEGERDPEDAQEESVDEEPAAAAAPSPPRQPPRPRVARSMPTEVGPLRLGMSLEQAQAAVPNERSWRRRARGRPMPDGELYWIYVSIKGHQDVRCQTYFCDAEGICSVFCEVRYEFDDSSYGEVRGAFKQEFTEAYGLHTRHFNRNTNHHVWWWTHPESELRLRYDGTPRANLRGGTGHGILRLRLESAFYQQWHEENPLP